MRDQTMRPFKTKIFLFALLSLLGLLGCQTSQSTNTTLQHPTLAVSFDPSSLVNADEKKDLIQKMLEAGFEPKGNLQFSKELSAGNNVFEEAKKNHLDIVEMKNKVGAYIVQNDRVDIHLKYVSTQAKSESGAMIQIWPKPNGASLFIDTPIPGIEKYLIQEGEKKGSIQLNEGDSFKIGLSFQYIMSTPYIYFRAQYLTNTRYFYYDMKSQEQKEVASQEEWEKHKRGEKAQ